MTLYNLSVQEEKHFQEFKESQWALNLFLCFAYKAYKDSAERPLLLMAI